MLENPQSLITKTEWRIVINGKGLKTIMIGQSAAKSRIEKGSTTILGTGVETSVSKWGALNHSQWQGEDIVCALQKYRGARNGAKRDQRPLYCANTNCFQEVVIRKSYGRYMFTKTISMANDMLVLLLNLNQNIHSSIKDPQIIIVFFFSF